MTWQPPKNYETRPVTVLGGGVLGRRIAACWVAAGYTVIIRDPSSTSCDDAVAYVKRELGTYTAISERKPGHVEATEDLAAAVKDSWLVFEAVPEKLSIKEATFADLERLAPEDCIFASNSSSYKSGELVGKLREETKTRVLNTHYMMPPQALIVELMTDGYTTPELVTFLFDRHKEAGLHPIVALKESTGFVFNRVWAAIKRETLKVLQESVSTPAEIDRVFMEQYGSPIGPCAMMDNVGLDTVELIEEHYIKERNISRDHVDWLHENYVKEGKLGKKTNKGGLYDVAAPGSRTKLFFLNLGTAEKIDDKASIDDIMHRGQILSLNVDEGAMPVEIISKDYMPDGIDISRKEGRIYWTDMGNPNENDGSIHSANLDGSDVKVIVPTGAVHTPKQCVIDEASQKLYFCDREGLRVMRVNLDGSNLETLVQNADWQTEPEKMRDQTNWCVGIAVSPKSGKFYWTQKGPSKGNQGRIFTANIDFPAGTNASSRKDIEVVLDHLPEPIDLDLNDDETVLYWSDRGELPLGNTLNKKTIVGDVPAAEKKLGRQILAQGLGEGIGLMFDEKKNCIWVADMAGRIWKCNPDKPALKEKVYEGRTSCFTGLTFMHV